MTSRILWVLATVEFVVGLALSPWSLLDAAALAAAAIAVGRSD